MLSADELKTIVQRLISRTRDRGIEWRALEETQHEYYHRTNAFGYFIRSRDGDDRRPFVLEIYKYRDPGSKPVLIVDADSGMPDGYSLQLEDLYDLAKKSALGLQNIAASILDDLN